MKRLISKEEEPKIVSLYHAGQTHEALAKKYGVDRFCIGRILRANGVKGRLGMARIYQIDESLFENIDCEWKAYFLGWMYSDGNISKNGYEACLQLSEKDKAVLDRFNSIIYKGAKTLQYYAARSCAGTSGLSKPSYKLRILNKKICSDLIKLGVYPAKSLITRWPALLPKSLMPHFIRGVFEGDGYISKDASALSILGSKAFIKGLRDYLLSRFPKMKIYLKPAGKVYRMNLSERASISTLMHYLYDGAELILPRKKIIPTRSSDIYE